VAAQVWQICNRGCRAAPGGPTPTRAGGCGPSAPAAPANEHPGPRLRPGATAQVGQTQLKIAEPTPSCRLLEKGATCDAGGPSLGRKRPRRAAVTQAATAPQQYDPALHNAQAKKVSKCCSINARRRPLPEQMSTLYQHVRENPERVKEASGGWVRVGAILGPPVSKAGGQSTPRLCRVVQAGWVRRSRPSSCKQTTSRPPWGAPQP
jgi:hypothetical protein